MNSMEEDFINLGSTKLEIVPVGQRLQEFDPLIWLTTFTDTDAYHPRLIDKIKQREVVERIGSPAESRNLEAQKLHDMNEWGYAEVELLNARAKTLFKCLTNSPDVHINQSWISIYREHEYMAPHSHQNSSWSAVYILDEGDNDPLSGRFSFVDPRLDKCCGVQKHYMTTPVHMVLPRGTLMMFSSHLLHMASPYQGKQPRIAMSWTLNAKPASK